MKTAAPAVSRESLPESFERIYKDHSRFVYRTAYRITGRAEDAEDVVQTLFLGLLRRALPSDFEETAKAYLYRAAVNTSLNLLRSRNLRLAAASMEDLCDAAQPAVSAPSDNAQERLRLAMADLRPKAVEILVLRYVHGFSVSEIAELLGTSRGTIAVSLFRTRSRLRKSIRALERMGR